MPIYEFHCNSCTNDSELLVRSSAWQGTQCPHCGSTQLAKKFSVFAEAGTGTGTGGGDAGACATGGGGGGCCGGHGN